MDLITEQKLERRTRILESVRDLIGKRGYQGVTIRDLAAHCRVSVPTLYNQFGSKDGLLSTAVESHFSGLVARMNLGQTDPDDLPLIRVVELCSAEMTRLTDYHRALLRAFMAVRETARIQAALNRELATALERALVAMAEQDQLEDWVLPRVLARRITAACVGASVAWAIGDFDDRELRAAMVHDASSMALGAARGAAREPLEHALRQAQAELDRGSRREPQIAQATAAAG